MKSKLGFTLIATLLFLLIPRATEAAKTEGALSSIANYEMRLRTVEQRLEKVASPIQQMGPETADSFETGLDDVQMSFDEVNERLAMIRFVMNRERSAPRETRDLAQAELAVLEADLQSLEEESASFSNEVDAVIWY